MLQTFLPPPSSPESAKPDDTPTKVGSLSRHRRFAEGSGPVNVAFHPQRDLGPCDSEVAIYLCCIDAAWQVTQAFWALGMTPLGKP